MSMFRRHEKVTTNPKKRFRGFAAAAFAVALAFPLVPLLGPSSAQAAANVTFSNGTVSRGGSDIDESGAVTSVNALQITKWTPGEFLSSGGRYVVVGFDIAIAEEATPGDTFEVTLPEFWVVRGATSLVDLTDDAGNVIATVEGVKSPGPSKITFTLTDYVVDHESIHGSYSFQAQEISSSERPAGYYEGAVVGNGTQHILDLKVNVPEAKWPTPVVALSWGGDTNTPRGSGDIRSRPSWNGASDVAMTFVADNGYDIDCAALKNQNPNSGFGIGLANIGTTRTSAVTSEDLLDPSGYTLDCSADEFTLKMPASSWTDADAQTGQVLRAVFPRTANGEQDWQQDDGIYGYLHLEQDGGKWDLSSFNPRPDSSAIGRGNQLPPGEFQSTVFEDLNGNNVYDKGVDALLPGIEILVEGTTALGTTVSQTTTTDNNGFVSLELREGDYTATIQNAPVGMIAVATDSGNNDTVDSDYSDGVVAFTIASRETTKRDAGYRAPTSTFKMSKQITGASASLVSADTTFTVNYSYPAGDTFRSGSGTIELPADGTLVESGPVPIGAVLTFTEQTPAAIEGAKWAHPVFAPESVIVGDGTTPEVTLTNTINEAVVDDQVIDDPVIDDPVIDAPVVDDAAKTEQAASPPADAVPGLSVTGGAGAGLLVVAALVLFTGGVALLVVRRRRGRAE